MNFSAFHKNDRRSQEKPQHSWGSMRAISFQSKDWFLASHYVTLRSACPKRTVALLLERKLKCVGNWAFNDASKHFFNLKMIRISEHCASPPRMVVGIYTIHIIRKCANSIAYVEFCKRLVLELAHSRTFFSIDTGKNHVVNKFLKFFPCKTITFFATTKWALMHDVKWTKGLRVKCMLLKSTQAFFC